MQVSSLLRVNGGGCPKVKSPVWYRCKQLLGSCQETSGPFISQCLTEGVVLLPLTTSVTDPNHDKYLLQLIANWCLINGEITSEVQATVAG